MTGSGNAPQCLGPAVTNFKQTPCRDPALRIDLPIDAQTVSEPSCTLSILAGPRDLPFFAQIVRHLVRVSRFPFSQRILIADTEPRQRSRSPNDVELLERFRIECDALRRESVIDTVIELDLRRDRALRRRLAQRHFQGTSRETRDFRGAPLFGWIASLDQSEATYHLHFDSDILLYQEANYCWMQDAFRVLRDRPDVMFISPLPGPPRKDGQLIQPNVRFEQDADGFFSFKTFSSRRFLVDRRRFDELLPLKFTYASRRHRMLSFLNGKSAACNWEQMVDAALRQSPFCRAHLESPKAWSLHIPDHSPRFVEMLPSLISHVEAGLYPEEQAGHYDLNLDLWEHLPAYRGPA